MAALWADNFQAYGTDPAFLLNGIYAGNGCTLVDDPDPLVTQTVCFLGIFFSGLRKVLPASKTGIVGVAARFWFAGLPSGGGVNIPGIIAFNDAANTNNVSIAVTSTGAIQVSRGPVNGGTILGTSAPVLVSNAFNHVEALVKCNNTTGSIQVYVNGISILNLTAIDTAVTLEECSQINFSSANGFDGTPRADVYMRDLFIWDDTGALNNSVAGTVNVISLVPTSDNSLNWAPSTGTTGFDILDNSPPVDTIYIGAVTPPPSPAKFNMSNLPANVTSVRTLMTLVRAGKSDSGDGSLRNALISGASTGLGVDRPITQPFTYYSDIFETDPATAAAWTPGAVDAVVMQLNRTL